MKMQSYPFNLKKSLTSCKRTTNIGCKTFSIHLLTILKNILPIAQFNSVTLVLQEFE